jgi:PIN domain nuclease of toxin-antitoxin system
MMLYVLDTHVLVWYFTGSARLSPEARNIIDQVRQQGGRLLVPTIVLAEALNVAAKGRVVFDFQTLYQLVRAEPEFEIVEFGIEIFDETRRARDPRSHHRRHGSLLRGRSTDQRWRDPLVGRSWRRVGWTPVSSAVGTVEHG